MSFGWSIFVIILVVINIVGALWLLYWTSRPDSNAAETTGHVWDNNLREYNNPLPRWWLWLFYITVIFTIIYFILYPGFGNLPGVLGWSQESRYESQVESANQQYAPIFNAFMQKDIAALAKDADALKTGQRLFVNRCAACHGSDARGAPGFPNLHDSDWLYGGTPEAIKASITNGRTGVMPTMGAALGEDGVKAVIAYIQSLSGQIYNADLTLEGQQKFMMFCSACHGADAKGNSTLGAPNLSDKIWLYGGSDSSIAETIQNGRNGKMPAHKSLLSKEKIHVLAAYVYSLNKE